MNLNFLIIALAALIPLFMGAIWYSKPVFGNAWIKASGTDPEAAKHSNMIMIFSVTYVLSFLMALSINFMVIHQWSMFSILANEPGFMEPGSESTNYMNDFLSKYGSHFRTFKHGAFHGFTGGLLMAMPIMVINALFEGKKFKYMAINCGYWIVSMMLMGGIICAFA